MLPSTGNFEYFLITPQPALLQACDTDEGDETFVFYYTQLHKTRLGHELSNLSGNDW
jgi:hypothetical protein